MININANKTLNIILPNTNKALDEVLKKASPKELQTLTQDKDLKSLLNNLLKQSLDAPSQNKTLLNLVKKNPTFKELGSTATSVKELLAVLTQDKNPLPLESTLKKLLNSLKPTNDTPKLQGNKTPDAKSLMENVKTSTNTPVQNNKTLQEFSKAVQTIDIKKLKPTVQTDVKALMEKVKVSTNPTPQDIKTITQSVKNILNTIVQDKSSFPVLEKTLKNFMSDISSIKDAPLKSKMENSGVFLEAKVKNLQTPKVELKQSMQELSKLLETSKLPSVKTIHTQLKELFATDLFKNISNKELLSNAKENVQVLLQLSKKSTEVVDKLQQRIAAPLEKSISPKDILFSPDTKSVLTKISTLAHPDKLTTQTQLKEMFSNDLKAILLKTHDEINSSTNPNKQEILKHIDKLTLQIDYHQLVSHLADSSSLYLPYAWDAMEDGNINVSKGKKDSFFCDINLMLKEYGELKLRLGIFEKNQLNINISSQSDELKEKIKEKLSELKQQLINAGITPKSIRFLDETSNSYTENSPDLDLGFEVKA